MTTGITVHVKTYQKQHGQSTLVGCVQHVVIKFLPAVTFRFTIIICFTVVTIYPDCKVINSLGAMANAALRTCTWLDVKRWEASLQPAVADYSQPTFVEFTAVFHHAKYQYHCS